MVLSLTLYVGWYGGTQPQYSAESAHGSYGHHTGANVYSSGSVPSHDKSSRDPRSGSRGKQRDSAHSRYEEFKEPDPGILL